MMVIRTKAVAYRDAPPSLTEKGIAELRQRLSEVEFDFNSPSPDLIFFLSGGSEQEAISYLGRSRSYCLLAGPEANAWAAATEVKAWAENQGIGCMLLPVGGASTPAILRNYAGMLHGFSTLAGTRAALIGEVSHWLVASHFPLSLAQDRFGITIEHLPWNTLPDYRTSAPDSHFQAVFGAYPERVTEMEARICGFLRRVVQAGKYDALTLECFEMVNKHHMTACLALALLNSQGIVAGCEGDTVSLTGLMFAKALTGSVPWMANIASVHDDHVLFAHCTAPLNILGSFEVNTHFETNKSAAIQGMIEGGEVTVFRLSQYLDKAFVAKGIIRSTPTHDFACRTQAEIVLDQADISKLRNHPLGNHHIVVPGNYEDRLKMALTYKQISLV